MRSQMLKLLILSGILLIVVGCSPSPSPKKDENIERIETVLKELFTGPSEELTTIFDDLKNGSTETTFNDFELYYEEKLKSYFTEGYYTKFVMTNKTSAFHQPAYRSGYHMEVKDMNVEKNQDTELAYDFTINVGYEKEGNDEQSIEVSGRANMNEDGKITRILYHNAGELIRALE